MDDALQAARQNNVWVFEHTSEASDALGWCKQRGIAVPGNLSIIDLQNDPAYLHRGITACVSDWQTAGYLIAHAMIGDIPIEKTRHGYVRISAKMLQRGTTR